MARSSRCVREQDCARVVVHAAFDFIYCVYPGGGGGTQRAAGWKIGGTGRNGYLKSSGSGDIGGGRRFMEVFPVHL